MTNEPKNDVYQHLPQPRLLFNNRCFPIIAVNLTQMGTQKASDCFIQSNYDYISDVYSSMKGDTKQIKRYANEIRHHDRSTDELRPDGSILIPPHPRQLPNEIVSLILNQLSEQQEHLYECTLATKQFYAMANPLLWKAPCFMDNYTSERFLACLSGASDQRLAMIGRHIRELRLDDPPHWTDAQLVRLLPHIPHLKHLSIHQGTTITDVNFQHLPYHCQFHLTSLKLVGMAGLTRASFSAIGQYCHRLCEFVWFVSLNQSPHWLAMLTSCPLETLKIHSSRIPLNQNVMTIIQTFDRLTCLDLAHKGPDHMKSLLLAPPPPPPPPPPSTGNSISNNQHDGTTTNSTVTTAAPLWPGLTKLTLNPCHDLDDATLIGFIKAHPHLQDLYLVKGSPLTDTSLDAMAVWLPHLTHVTIAGNPKISSHGVRRLIQFSRSNRLTSITLRVCGGIAVPDDFPEATCKSGKRVELDRQAIEKIKQAQ